MTVAGLSIRAVGDASFGPGAFFPLLDRFFGTYQLPHGQWSREYDIENHPVPPGYWRQFVYPLRSKKMPQAAADPKGGQISAAIEV